MGEHGNTCQKMTVPEAQEEFLSILRRMNDEENLKKLLSWIHWNWLNSCTPPSKKRELPDDVLSAIADDIRSELPPDAILPSETIVTSTVGPNSDCDPNHSIHVDAFLYDDEMVDKLCDEGQIPRSYCLQCGSRKTKPLTYFSHSASRERINLMFNALLPPIDGKVVLDIGSRLGGILYGAFLYTRAAKIVGIEMNSDFCKLQREVIKKYNFQDRIEIIEDNVINRPDVVQAADVIIMNNVFEFFMDLDHQVMMWSFLQQTIRKGTLLVTVPPLEETFADLPVNINLAAWVQEMPPFNDDAPNITNISSELSAVKKYQVL
ncbi:hypothetical protein R5R35_004591 [Gryllus longicercus]|uniref:Methyltransferase type 11 domain-containing protein n=1 Tax=Gryllus longicercus TaxID=2509291 RepID=A0AAN9W6I5_9ORTH